MAVRVVLKEVPKGIAAMLVAFALIESLLRIAYVVRNSLVEYVPLPYTLGYDYGPVPPWVDGLRILEPDRELIWKNRPSLRRSYIDIFSPVRAEEERTSLLRQFFPTIPVSLRGNPVWEIRLNSQGFRDVEFPREKRSSAFRIVCIGDSWTFGANVGEERAYPQRLSALLGSEFPRAIFEVLNLGVLGYSSYQGLELLRRRAGDLDPDIVVIGFAENDASVTGYHDKEMPAYKEPVTPAKRINPVLEKIELYRLLRYLALVAKYRPESIGHKLKASGAVVDYEKLDPWTRVSLRDYEENIRGMIDLARRRAAGVILLYNALSRSSPYRRVLDGISRAEGVPLVDSSTLIANARSTIEGELETKLDLRPRNTRRASPKGEIEVVFRVYVGGRPVRKAVYIVGTHEKLGDLVPNRVAMYDDGTYGDERAGDNVWSYSATFSAGTRLFYVYTNSGEEGKWDGLDVPEIRSLTVDAKLSKVYRPIESFGKIYMQADSWHTNAAGYELIARAVREKLKQDEGFLRYLARSVKGAR